MKNFREPVEGSKPFSEAKNELSDFNIETLKLASAFSFIVSLLIAIVGVNFLSQLVVDPKGVSLGFRVVDTILTASLLAEVVPNPFTKLLAVLIDTSTERERTEIECFINKSSLY
ncbi:hypothetical protein L5163_000504 [Vibrio parahaemolyticus]|nr:hypothetical protein [Vibrio parahaemolyticus]